MGIGRSHAIFETNRFDNGSLGNYWSNYNGTDADHDGVGDTPYVIDANQVDHYPLMAPFNFSSADIPLSGWTFPTPSPSPSLSPSPSPSTSSSPSPTATQQPTPSNLATPTDGKPSLHANIYLIAVGVVVVVAALIVVAVFFRSRKRNLSVGKVSAFFMLTRR